MTHRLPNLLHKHDHQLQKIMYIKDIIFAFFIKISQFSQPSIQFNPVLSG